jgi:hypothetical protein
VNQPSQRRRRGGRKKAGRKPSRRLVNLEEDEDYSTCDELNVLDDSDYYSCDEVEVPSILPAPTIEAQAKSRVTPRSAKRSPGSDRLAAQAQLIADYRQTKDQHCQEAMEEDGELVRVHWNPYTPVESGDSTTPCVEQPTFGWSRDKKKEGDFLGYGRKTQPSEVVDHNDTEFEIWQKVVRPDIVVHEWVKATNYRAQQWFKNGRGNREEEGAHTDYPVEEGDNLGRGKLYGLQWVDVTYWEMMIWILLSFMMVAIGLPQEGDYWTPVAIAMFPAFNFHYFSDMSFRRYKQIKRFFCCQAIKKEDVETEGTRRGKPKDKVHRLRPFITHLNRMFLLLVVCGFRWSIDESMIPYYGRYCPIKVYMKDKPDKFGMKVWGINDPDSGYLLQFKVYEGRGDRFPGESDTWCDIWGLGERVVLAFLRCIPRGSIVFTDRFFTTPMLAAYMYIVCGIYLTGTVMKNKLGVDTSLLMKQTGKLARGFFKWSIDFQNHVAQVCWFDRSVVFLCSSIHAIRSTLGVMRLTWNEVEGYCSKPMQAPEMALEYNGGMFGTDRGDRIKLSRRCSCERNLFSKRWELRLFWGLMDFALANAFILYRFFHVSSNHSKWFQNLCNGMFYYIKNNMPGPLPQGMKMDTRKAPPKTPSRSAKSPVSVGSTVSVDESTEDEAMDVPTEHIRWWFKGDYKRSCYVCKKRGIINSRGKEREEGDGKRRINYPRSKSGCKVCNVALCNDQTCWDVMHLEFTGQAESFDRSYWR